MLLRKSIGWTLMLTAGAAFAQKAPPSGARELYYFSVSPKKDPLPPIKTAKTKPAPAATTPAPDNAVAHLGFRYSVVLVDEKTNKTEAVDKDRTFRRGECFAIEVEANRSGYLYVLAKQSNGAWLPLLPTTEMPDEPNVLDPGQKIRVPATHCFSISEPAGAETLWVALSRDPRDIFELNEAIKGGGAAPVKSSTDPVQMASARTVNKQVEAMNKQFGGTRNLSFKKVEKPQDPQESPYSFYVVNSSDKPMSTVVTQFDVKHQ